MVEILIGEERMRQLRELLGADFVFVTDSTISLMCTVGEVIPALKILVGENGHNPDGFPIEITTNDPGVTYGIHIDFSA